MTLENTFSPRTNMFVCWVNLQSGHSDLLQFLLRFLNRVIPEMLKKALRKGYLSRECPAFLWKMKLMKVNFILILAATVVETERNRGFDRESAKINLSVHSLTVGQNLPSLRIVCFGLQYSLQQLWTSQLWWSINTKKVRMNFLLNYPTLCLLSNAIICAVRYHSNLNFHLFLLPHL